MGRVPKRFTTAWVDLRPPHFEASTDDMAVEVLTCIVQSETALLLLTVQAATLVEHQRQRRAKRKKQRAAVLQAQRAEAERCEARIKVGKGKDAKSMKALK